MTTVEHKRDRDCDVNPETDTCRGCGVADRWVFDTDELLAAAPPATKPEGT